MMKTPLLPLLLILTSCGSTPENYGSPVFDRREGDTQYRVEERPGGGFVLTVRREGFHFNAGPEMVAFEQRCRQDVLALAHEEAAKRGLQSASVVPARVRTSAGRNPWVGISTCTAQVGVY